MRRSPAAPGKTPLARATRAAFYFCVFIQKYKFTLMYSTLPPSSALRVQTFNKFTRVLRDRVNADEKRATLLRVGNFTCFTRYCLTQRYIVHGYLLAAD